MKNIHFVLFASIIGLLISCSNSKEKRKTQDYLSSFILNNENIVSFGKFDLNTVLDKTGYQDVAKIGAIVKSEKKQLDKAIAANSSIYFAVEGPFDTNGNPAAFYAFFDVANADSLKERLGVAGLFVEKKKDLFVSLNEDVSIGFNENLAVLISKKEKYDGNEALISLFEKVEGNVSGGKVDQILSKKSDLIAAVDLEALYSSSNTSLNKLDLEKRKELKNMVKNSYLESSLNFEKGKLILETKNHFSSALEKRMFFVESDNTLLLEKLGKGDAKFGLAANLDMLKLENILDDFAPDFKQKIVNSSFQMQLAMMTLGEKPLSKLLAGRFGLVLVGDLMKDGSITPEVNFHVGLGDKGNSFSDLAQNFFELSGSKKNAAGMIESNNMEIKITSTEITGNTKNAGKGITRLQLPTVASAFGQKGITLFLDFKGMNVSSFGFNNASKPIELIENATFEMNNSGSRLLIHTKNKEENILKQVLNLYVKDIELKLASFSI